MKNQRTNQLPSLARALFVAAVLIGTMAGGGVANGQYQGTASVPLAHEKSAPGQG